jgi:predicted Zn finger-like uncharacterized protein
LPKEESLEVSFLGDAPASTDTAVTPAAAPEVAVEKQPLYGTTLDLPDTYARCGACQTSFALTDDDLGASGRGRDVTYYLWTIASLFCPLLLMLLFFHKKSFGM